MKTFVLFLLNFIISFLFISISAADMKELDKKIQDCRTREITLVLKNIKGKLIPQSDITIEQTRQAFLFGCNIFLWDEFKTNQEMQKLYRDQFAAVFNYATLPFYWGTYEAQKGVKLESYLSNIALWCRDRGIRTKGHPLVWHEVVPAWADFSGDETDSVLEARVREIIKKYKGLIDTFDVINESLAGPNYTNCVGRWEKKLGPVEAARRSLSWAREANPAAFLLVNDYDTSETYASEISVLKELEFPPDAIGIQSHMHMGIWPDRNLLDVVSLFSRYGIPIHFTELTILSGRLKTDNDWFSFHPGWNTTTEGEKKQAEDVERVYKLLFSSPSVEAITWWDLSDYNAWQGAPAGLLRKDMTPKPAYEVLKRLVTQEWRTGPLSLKTDEKGQAAFRGFFGRYKLTIGEKTIEFDLDKKSPDKIGVIVK